TWTAQACAPNAHVTVSGRKNAQAWSPGAPSRRSVGLRSEARASAPSSTRRSARPVTCATPCASTTSAGAHSSISAATSRALRATSRVVRWTAGPATAATRLAILPLPYPSTASPPPHPPTPRVAARRAHRVAVAAALGRAHRAGAPPSRVPCDGPADLEVDQPTRSDLDAGALERADAGARQIGRHPDPARRRGAAASLLRGPPL